MTTSMRPPLAPSRSHGAILSRLPTLIQHLIGIVGTAAIANAVYHAAGIRIRDLPITLDKLLP